MSKLHDTMEVRNKIDILCGVEDTERSLSCLKLCVEL